MRRPYLALFALIIFMGCGTAATPPQRSVSDFKMIAGTWRGSNNFGNPVDLIIRDDGRFDAIIIAPQGTARRQGQIRMEGQQLVYDADSSYGRIVYREGDGKRKLIMYGTQKEGGATFVIEYSQTQ